MARPRVLSPRASVSLPGRPPGGMGWWILKSSSRPRNTTTVNGSASRGRTDWAIPPLDGTRESRFEPETEAHESL